MTTNSSRQTAKIYQFPAGGRAALRDQRPYVKPEEESAAARAPVKTVLGGSWYHEEAIREADTGRKR